MPGGEGIRSVGRLRESAGQTTGFAVCLGSRRDSPRSCGARRLTPSIVTRLKHLVPECAVLEHDLAQEGQGRGAMAEHFIVELL